MTAQREPFELGPTSLPRSPRRKAASARLRTGSGGSERIRGIVVPRVARQVAGTLSRSFASRSVTWACGATVALHLLFLTRFVGSDEGGFAMVAKYAAHPGPYLYGPQWVDRPPILIGVYALANLLGPYGSRIVATACAVLLVAAVAWAASLARGASAARWAGWVACALASSEMFEAQALNGELVAAAAVAASIAAALKATDAETGPRPQLWWAAVAGATALFAMFTKQNFVDAIAFAGVFWLLSARRGLGARRFAQLTGSFVAGALVPTAVCVAWGVGHGGVGALAYAMYGFRLDASKVMSHWSLAAPQHRAHELLYLAIVSGLVLLLAALAVHLRRLRHLDPLPWAIAAAFVVELIGVIGGGNFWSHYVIGLFPTVALTAGLACGPGRRRHRQGAWVAGTTRVIVLLALAVTLVADPSTASAQSPSRTNVASISTWLRHSAHPGDTLVVPYTHANVIDLSGLRPVYPYSWSLPLRTLDPHLNLLVRTLSGPRAPTWVVQWDSPHTWGLDPNNRLIAALAAHYRQVSYPCGHPVWLHDGVRRTLAAPIPEGDCGGLG